MSTLTEYILIMTKKIGRNDPCPCGSGKKYKKCCINSSNDFDFTPPSSEKKNNTLEFIKSNNSASLLNFIIGLQLQPNNHGKNIRIEELATYIVTNLNDKPNCDLESFKKHLDTEYDYNPMEDLPENLFCENIVFYGGNYTVFSGIYGYAVEMFKNLTETIFTQKNNLPDKFKNHVYSGITLILELGEILSKKYNVGGFIQGAEGDSKFDFSFDVLDTSFSYDEIYGICLNHKINPEIIKDFIISPSDKRFSIDDPDLNPLLYSPIVLFENKFYFVLISNQINALNEFIIRLSNEYKCNKELVELYHSKLWHEHWGACDKMGWQLTDIKIPENTHPSILKERIFQFDTNRIAYACYLHNDNIDDKFQAGPSMGVDFDINQRTRDIISELKKDPTFKDYKFFSLLTYENMGRNMFLMLEGPQENELRLTIPIHQFILLCASEEWHNLSLWKYAKSYEIFSKNTQTTLTDTLDLYSIYKSKDESFYFGDDARPNFLTVVPGDGSRLIKDAKIEKDNHGILAYVDGRKAYIPSERYADYAPLYKPLHSFENYSICLKVFDFPIWLVNRQVEDKKMAIQVRNFAEAIAFWLYKLSPQISVSLNSNISDTFEINIILEKTLFEDKQTKDIVENSEDNQYSFNLNGNSLDINIPFSKVKTFIGDSNSGERELMRALLSAFNLVNGINFPSEFINQSIDIAMPLGNAKMILLSDSQNDPLVDNRWLVKPFYITNSEIERILDEIPVLIENTKKIPVTVEKAEDKKELFNTATQILIETLAEEIKVFEFEFLLDSLVRIHESLVWKREHNKTIIPAQILCFGDLEGKLKEMQEDENKLVQTSLATRCLIEYIAAQPPNGSVKASFDDIDRLLVLMHEIANYGFLSDAVHFKLANPTIGKLKSGRIGISREFFDEKLKPFSEAHRKEEVDGYVERFESRFEISKHTEESKDEKTTEDKELTSIDNAFLADWGIGYLNIYKFCFSCYALCIEGENSSISIEENELIKKLVNEFKLPKNEVIAGIKRFSIFKRTDYLKAPEGYNDNEVFPWKYNREFSFARRFIIKHENEKGESILTWGFRNTISAQKQLSYLLYEGKLNNGGRNIEKLLGTFRERKGKEYRNKVKDWLKQNKNLNVIDYEVDISPNGHLKADKKYGDVDILVHDTKSNIVWSLECKDTNKAKNIHEMKKEMDNYLGREGGKGMIKKHVDRHIWLTNNKDKICAFLKINEQIEVVSYMLTSEVIPTTYIKAEKLLMPILAFPDLKREGIKLLYPAH